MAGISLVAATAAAFFPVSCGCGFVYRFSIDSMQPLIHPVEVSGNSQLSQYLRKINTGNYSLDIRDNQEGELSILKNDIYKVTLMLTEQSKLWQQEKLRLTDVIADISHQLKTPLTSMLVMADLLSDSKLPEAKRSEFTHKIVLQLERIDWLVSSLLKLSKIDAGTAVLKRNW